MTELFIHHRMSGEAIAAAVDPEAYVLAAIEEIKPQLIEQARLIWEAAQAKVEILIDDKGHPFTALVLASAPFGEVAGVPSSVVAYRSPATGEVVAATNEQREFYALSKVRASD